MPQLVLLRSARAAKANDTRHVQYPHSAAPRRNCQYRQMIERRAGLCTAIIRSPPMHVMRLEPRRSIAITSEMRLLASEPVSSLGARSS